MQSRRQFIRQVACSAVGYSALLSVLTDLQKLNAATSTDGDYRALVCLFLYGGNDGANMLVPYSTADYSSYSSARGLLGLDRSTLLPLSPSVKESTDYAFHPVMPELQKRFNSGKVAVLRNVGTLVAPLTLQQYAAGGSAVPSQLFAHDAQSTLWQTSIADGTSTTGWGGRTADLLSSLNANSKVSMSISVAGSNSFQMGSNVFQYIVSPNGVIPVDGYTAGSTTDPESAAIDQILARQNQNIFENAYRATTRSAIDTNLVIKAALDTAPTLKTVFPATDFGSQLAMIARLISIRSVLGHKRQIFFCSMGGWDTHGDQLTLHAKNLSDLSQGMDAFYSATEEMGASDNVTSFTASDFGRTYSSNGHGSDHGWGNHQLIMGGAVKGGRFYGKMPSLAIGGPDDTGSGRWIPTTSVDEYSATLAKWFGVSSADLPLVFPNLGRFQNKDLGFMG